MRLSLGCSCQECFYQYLSKCLINSRKPWYKFVLNISIRNANTYPAGSGFSEARVCIQNQSFNNSENDTKKLSVNEAKLTGLWEKNCATIHCQLVFLISNFGFGPEKLSPKETLNQIDSLWYHSYRNLSEWPICTMASFCYQDQNSFRFFRQS